MGTIAPVLLWKDRSPLYIHSRSKLCFILFKISQKTSKKLIILKFFKHFPKYAPLPLLNFGVNPKFDRTPLCVYYRRKTFRRLARRPLGKGRVNVRSTVKVVALFLDVVFFVENDCYPAFICWKDSDFFVFFQRVKSLSLLL